MDLIGFTGSRSLHDAWWPLVRSVVRSVQASGRGVATGCAPGADAMVRAAAPDCRRFSVASVAGRAAFVGRSSAMVSAVAASGPGAGFAAFADQPCPRGIAPDSAWRSGDVPSGTWSTAALAAGLGLPVIVFWCASGEPDLPAAWGGSWEQAAPSGPWALGFKFVPDAVNLPLPGFERR